MAKTTDVLFDGWTIVVPGSYPSGALRYRLDRYMSDQSPPVSDEGHFDTIEGAVRASKEFNVNNADDVRIWDLKQDHIVAKRSFID